MLLVGLMSGTSADGVDAALVRIEGTLRAETVNLIAFVSEPFPEQVRAEILRACDPAGSTAPAICALNSALGYLYASAAATVALVGGVSLDRIECIACHGQTIWHQPSPVLLGRVSARSTLQIGSPAVISALTGCRVVSDFRAADVAVGGQGAPLVTYADWVLFGDSDEHRAVQNIGGIANVTHLPAGSSLGDVIAFDTGPGNMVIDGVVARLSDGALQMDEDGAWAAQGTPHQRVLRDLIDREPYFRAAPPKTTGRERFGSGYVEQTFLPACRRAGLCSADTVATATALTYETIATAYERYLIPRGAPARVIVGGGGSHNRTLMTGLAERIKPMTLESHEVHGISDDAKEAVAFAVLAYETLAGRPSNVPSATGARRQVVLGSVTCATPA